MINTVHKKEITTFSTSGFMQTPWYGENFSVEKFRFKTDYTYEIRTPSIAQSIMTLVLKIDIDTMKAVGKDEKVEINYVPYNEPIESFS